MTKRTKIGDVIEIPTSKGLTYVQYTHRHSEPPVFGDLIRVLQGFYEKRPSRKELEEIVKKPHRFSTFFPVKYTVARNIFENVGHFEIPEFAQKFPTFKNATGLKVKFDPDEANWWLWDGEKEWKVGKLSREEQMKYPELAVYNDTGLIHAIETGKTQGRDLC
ncbi:MAG: hypothetical protein Tsb0015_13620 [Simkaniaceae bacterium]